MEMKKLNKRRSKLLEKLEQYADFVRGSLTQVCATCNRAKCICLKKTTRKTYRLTYKDNQQKTKTVYIPRRHQKSVLRKISNYKNVRKITEDLNSVNVEILKLSVRNDQL